MYNRGETIKCTTRNVRRGFRDDKLFTLYIYLHIILIQTNGAASDDDDDDAVGRAIGNPGTLAG